MAAVAPNKRKKTKRTVKTKVKVKVTKVRRKKRGLVKRWKTRKEREMVVLADGPVKNYFSRREIDPDDWDCDLWEEYKNEQIAVVQFKPQVRNVMISGYSEYEDYDDDEAVPIQIIKRKRGSYRVYHLSMPSMVFVLFQGRLFVCFAKKRFRSFEEFKKSDIYVPPFPNQEDGYVCLGVAKLPIEKAVKKYWNTLFDDESCYVAEWPDLRTYNRWHRETSANPKFIDKMRWPKYSSTRFDFKFDCY